MLKELQNKIENIEKNNDSKFNTQINKTKSEIKDLKQNIDNIIFCRLKNEVIKNDEILLNINTNESNEISMMRMLTGLNIIPTNIKKKEKKENNNFKTQYQYFLLSKNKTKNIQESIEPFEFWNSLIKFNGIEKDNKNSI